MARRFSGFAVLCVCLLGSACRTSTSGTAGGGSWSSGELAAGEAAAPVDLGRAPLPGRYLGQTRLAGRKARVTSMLELVYIGRVGDDVRYLAFFKMLPGGLGSHENMTLYFREARFREGDDVLELRGGPEGATAEARREGEILKGHLSLAKGAAPAAGRLDFELQRGDQPLNAFASLPSLGHLTGNYLGKSCPDHVVSLQLEVSKWRGLEPRARGLFGGHRVTGRLGQRDDLLCGAPEVCLKEAIGGGLYDVLTGTLALEGAKGRKLCRVSGADIHCDGVCSFTKGPAAGQPHAVVDVAGAAKLQVFPRGLSLEEDEGAAPGESQGRGGQYYGYLHHEQRDVYQLVALNVPSPPKPGASNTADPQKEADGVLAASLYFGEGDSSEYVAYRLRPTPRLGPEAPLVLEGAGEALLVVREWSDQRLVGDWYGKTHGRVGTIELQKDLVPAMPPSLARIGAISGVYQGEGWDFELTAAALFSEDAADFYPLKVFGWARERLKHARRRAIEEGVYDYHAGVIALRLDDGRTILGRPRAGELELYWSPSPRSGSLMASGRPLIFKRVGDPSAPRAKLRQEAPPQY